MTSNASAQRIYNAKPSDELGQHGPVQGQKPRDGSLKKSVGTSHKQADAGKGSSILSSMDVTYEGSGQPQRDALKESMRVNALKWAALKEKQSFKTIDKFAPKTLQEKKHSSPSFKSRQT